MVLQGLQCDGNGDLEHVRRALGFRIACGGTRALRIWVRGSGVALEDGVDDVEMIARGRVAVRKPIFGPDLAGFSAHLRRAAKTTPAEGAGRQAPDYRNVNRSSRR